MTLDYQRIEVPWTDEQVKTLNRFQRCGMIHPFTCGSTTHPPQPDLSDKSQPERLKTFRSFEQGRILVAKNDGWHCPSCDYTQDWAYGFMANDEVVTQLEKDAAMFGFHLRMGKKNENAQSDVHAPANDEPVGESNN